LHAEQLIASVLYLRSSNLFSKSTSKARKQLTALHAAGIIHVDPRIPNMVQVDDKYKWIDFGLLKLFGHLRMNYNAMLSSKT
jgi:tRNA A-37 threonylcarbamoyl transferase component Bud32